MSISFPIQSPQNKEFPPVNTIYSTGKVSKPCTIRAIVFKMTLSNIHSLTRYSGFFHGPPPILRTPATLRTPPTLRTSPTHWAPPTLGSFLPFLTKSISFTWPQRDREMVVRELQCSLDGSMLAWPAHGLGLDAQLHIKLSMTAHAYKSTAILGYIVNSRLASAN